MKHVALRQEICRVGRSLFERGYVHATAGNISVRLPDGDGTLITPTDACLGHLQPERLAWVDDAGQQLSGDRASKTLVLHRQIYAAAPAAHCVLHSHSSHLVAMSLLITAEQRAAAAETLLPPITPYFVMKVGRVPLLPYHRPGDPAVGPLVADAVEHARRRGATLRAVMLDRLGPNVWHDSPASAMATLEELEETAKLWLMCTPRPTPLNAEQLTELQQTFGAVW